jgi:hypothetical protein
MKFDIADFLSRNAWAIIMIVGSSVLFYANTNSRLGQIEAKAVEAREEAASLRSLVERIIILEEHDKTIVDDIAEIKQDLKEIKQLVR